MPPHPLRILPFAFCLAACSGPTPSAPGLAADALAQAGFSLPEAGGGLDGAGGVRGGVDPGRSLAAVERDRVRWGRARPVDYAAMPARIERSDAGTGGADPVRPAEGPILKGRPEDGAEALRRLDVASRRRVGSVCVGC